MNEFQKLDDVIENVEFVTYVDTRTDSHHAIGEEMYNGAGGMGTEECIELYGGSIEDAAQSIADFHKETGAAWIDFDGEALDVALYVTDYLK